MSVLISRRQLGRGQYLRLYDDLLPAVDAIGARWFSYRFHALDIPEDELLDLTKAVTALERASSLSGSKAAVAQAAKVRASHDCIILSTGFTDYMELVPQDAQDHEHSDESTTPGVEELRSAVEAHQDWLRRKVH